MTRGVFITLEGGEGAGKSTQAKRLAAWLGRAGHPVIVTREPGGSPKAERIRTFLLDGSAAQLGPFAEAILFSAARADHLKQTIRPALQRGAIVVCDRFADSTRAYQGALGNIEAGLLLTLEHVVVGEDRPDLTLIFDIPPKLGLARAAARRQSAAIDRFEAEADGFHEGLRQAFRDIAADEPTRCAVIDATGAPDAVEASVRKVVLERLGERVAVQPPPPRSDTDPSVHSSSGAG